MLNVLSTNVGNESMECALCAKRSVSVIKLKRAVYLLGIGTVTLTAYYVYKYWRLKKLLVTMENRVDELKSRLNETHFDGHQSGEYNELITLTLDNVNMGDDNRLSPSSSILSLISSSSSSDLFLDRQPPPTTTNPRQMLGKKKKSVSFGSDLDKYVTPATSPEPSEFEYDYVHVEPDDNETLERHLCKSYDELKILTAQLETDYENVP